MSLHIYLFDHLRITDGAGGPPRAVRSRAQRLVVFLLLNRRPLTREQVAFTLWPDGPESWALGVLRRALSDLRAVLNSPGHGEWILATDTALQWNRDAPCWIDVDAFQDAVIQGTPSALHRAIDLYVADLLVEWEDEWVVAERERLRQLRAVALRRLAEHYRALGRHPTAIALARQLVAHDPLVEPAHRDLISLLYASGDRAGALSAYEQLRELLDDELGVEPMTETQALRAAIVEGRPLSPETGRAVAPASPASHGPSLPALVGRDAELGTLCSLWDSAEAGRGRLATVSGEAGVGKSHLVRTLTGLVEARGGMPLVGHCYEFEQALPYQAIVEMLRAAGSHLQHAGLPAAHRSALARIAPDVLGASGILDSEDELLTADPRAQLFEALWQGFLIMARSQPTLLIIEDMHWAGESTIDWLTYITPRLKRAPILVVITYRTDEVEADHPLTRLQRRVARATSITTVPLAPLTPAAHRELVTQLSALSANVVSPIADRLYDDTLGNPFYLHEIIRELMETEQVVVRQGRWGGAFVDASGSADLPLPDSVRELITVRVERLDMTARTFAQVAAVAGRVFGYGIVRRAIGWTDEPALHALDELLDRGFVEQHDGPEDFAFTHHLIQEVIYAGMTIPRRTFWHRRLAGAIQLMLPDDAESLAHHFSRAGDEAQARTYYARAGDRAYRLAALDDAARYYTAALDGWPEADHAGRAELLYKLSHCQWVLSELQASLSTLTEARSQFEGLGNRLRVGDIERTIGRVYWELNDRQASIEHYHRALTILEREPESVELARAMSSISQMHMLAAEYDEAIAWGQRALALAERLGAEEVVVHAQTNIGLSLISPDTIERGLAMLRDSLRRALSGNLAHDAMRTYLGLAEQLLSLGRYTEAGKTYGDLLVFAQRVQSDLFTGIALRSLVQVQWLTGRWTDALTHRQQLLDWMQLGAHPHLATVWANRLLGTIHNDLGQPDLALDVLQRDLAAARGAAELQTTVPHLAELGRAFAILGREPDAVDVFQELIGWIDDSSHVVFDCILPSLVACQWFASRANSSNAGAIDACLTWLQHAVDDIGTVEARAALAEATGLALIAEGVPGRAAEQFQTAVERWAALKHPYDQARALDALGNALRRAGQVSAASTALDQAATIRDMLAAQIADADLKSSFLASPQMPEPGARSSRQG